MGHTVVEQWLKFMEGKRIIGLECEDELVAAVDFLTRRWIQLRIPPVVMQMPQPQIRMAK
jgi:hypothetical protein